MRLRVCFWSVAIFALNMPAFADTPRLCARFTDLPPLAADALRPTEREAAEALGREAGNVLKKLGASGAPILSRLKSSDPKASYLIAYVPSENEGILVLFVQSLLTGETHSLAESIRRGHPRISTCSRWGNNRVHL